MRIVRRLLVIVAMVFLATLNPPAAVDQATAAVPQPVPVLMVNNPPCSAPPVDVITERGPPTPSQSYTTHDTVDSTSRGASMRPRAVTTPAIHEYDGTTLLAQVDSASGVVEGPVLGDAGDLRLVVEAMVAANTAGGAESALSGALLRTHLRQLEKYGQGGFRELESGRFRYYGNLSPAAKQGELAGRRLAREWDPATG